MFLKVIVTILLFVSSTSATGLGSLLGDPVELPNVTALNPHDPVVTAKPPSGAFLDKLGLGDILNKVPCLGMASLKAGTCMDMDGCLETGGFHDGKGLCLKEGFKCCVQPAKCGAISILNETVIANEGFPKGIETTGDCIYTLKKPLGTAAIKFTIEDLEIVGPDHKTGECNTDAFWVEGTDSNLGKICGVNRKTHLYYKVSPLEIREIFIHVQLGSSSTGRRWLIRADFIDKFSPELPPPECTQYFTAKSGLLTSLNFDIDKNEGLGNIDGLKYRICVKQHKGFCQLQMIDRFFDMGEFSSHGKHLIGSGDSLTFSRRRSVRATENEESSRRLPPLNRPPQPLQPSQPPKPSNNFNNAVRPPPPVNYRPLPPQFPPGFQPTFNFNPIPQAMPYMPGHESFMANFRPMPFNHMMQPYPMMPMMYHPYYHPMFMRPEFIKDDKLDKLDGKLELLGDKLGLDKFGLDKLDKLEGKLETDKLITGKPVICPEQDFIVLPVPDDGTTAIHCGKDLHFGSTVTSSFPPFQILVVNKGKIHGKGFSIEYSQQVC